MTITKKDDNEGYYVDREASENALRCMVDRMAESYGLGMHACISRVVCRQSILLRILKERDTTSL